LFNEIVLLLIILLSLVGCADSDKSSQAQGAEPVCSKAGIPTAYRMPDDRVHAVQMYDCILGKEECIKIVSLEESGLELFNCNVPLQKPVPE
jgi:hypothetical protein